MLIESEITNADFYLLCVCSEATYARLFSKVKKKPGQQVQKYHRLFARGFALNGCDVNMGTALPLTRGNHDRILYRRSDEISKGLKYLYETILNIPGIKHICVVCQAVSIVLEGHVDSEMSSIQEQVKYKKFICLYVGALAKSMDWVIWWRAF